MPDRKPRIALLAAPETSASILYGLYDVLLSVGAMYPDMTMGVPGEALLDVVIVAARREPFRCFGNVLIEPHAAVAEASDVDVAIVCDMYAPIDSPPTGRYAVEIDWLRGVHARGGIVASVCSGALVLAESGLLDGRTCASHWAYRELFRTAYPKVRLQAGPVLDLASERDRVITAGGVTAWQDLALHLIRRLCGADHASRTAKVYLLAGHEAGQLPFAAMSKQVRTADPSIRRSVEWIAGHYTASNPVAAMIEASGLTPRTFARRFREATGRSPIEHVHALRIEAARELIEKGFDVLGDVGYEVGYEDPTFFRRLFRRETGITPAAYRRLYASIVQPPAA